MVEDKNTKYYAAFHGPQNKKFHNQLSLKTCEKLVPVVEKLLLKAQKNGEIYLEDPSTAARFCVYGQLGILLEDGMDQQEKAERIRTFLIYALHLWNIPYCAVCGRGLWKHLKWMMFIHETASVREASIRMEHSLSQRKERVQCQRILILSAAIQNAALWQWRCRCLQPCFSIWCTIWWIASGSAICWEKLLMLRWQTPRPLSWF